MREEEERSPEGAEDEDLIRRYQAMPESPGGRAALDALVSRWRGRVYLWAYRVVRERETALDVAQEALMQMIVALPHYQARGRFSAWLFTIVHNRSLNAVRRRPLVRDPELDTDDLSASDALPEHEYESAQATGRIFAAMQAALDPTEYRALWLRAFEGMGVGDITRLLQLGGASGARGVLQSARRKLRAALATPDAPGRDAS